MRYVSTRGEAPILSFDEVLLTGLARDGGLYLPEFWPSFEKQSWSALAQLDYRALAERIMRPFLAGSQLEGELSAAIEATYASFHHNSVAPLVQLEENLWLLELFHGPTLAFKDVAMQLLGQLFDRLLKKTGQRITIVGATSGDTGSAAIEAVKGSPAIDIFMLHPKGRTSEVQRRQMTTVDAANVHNIAIEGTFDDCQDLVKALFNDHAFRDRHHLSAVNSINWARVLAQTVYYAWAALALGAPQRPIGFVVPTGNFGNVFAGYVAKSMGLPIDRLLVASNRNDILARFFASGTMEMQGVEPSLSPSMDIQISSNFERLLFEMHARDGAAIRDLLTQFRAEGHFAVKPWRWQQLLQLFGGHRIDDAGTLAEIARVKAATGMTIDPHTAVATASARALEPKRSRPLVVLSTAHPAKFPDAVEKATGQRPPLPAHLADLYQRKERFDVLPNSAAALMSHIVKTLGAA